MPRGLVQIRDFEGICSALHRSLSLQDRTSVLNVVGLATFCFVVFLILNIVV